MYEINRAKVVESIAGNCEKDLKSTELHVQKKENGPAIFYLIYTVRPTFKLHTLVSSLFIIELVSNCYQLYGLLKQTFRYC